MAWSGLQNEAYELKEPLSFAQPILATNDCAIPASAQWWFRRKIYLSGSDCLWQYGVLSNTVKYGIEFNCKLVTLNCSIKQLMALNMFHSVWKGVSIKRASKYLSAFAKFWKVTINFVMSVCLSAYQSAWNNSAPTGRIFRKCDILVFFWKYVEKIQFSLKSDKNNAYFTWRPMYICNHISRNSSWNQKFFRQT